MHILSLSHPIACLSLALSFMLLLLLMRFDMVWWDGTWPALHFVIKIYHWGALTHTKPLLLCLCVREEWLCGKWAASDSLLRVLTQLPSNSPLPPPSPCPLFLLLLYLFFLIGVGRELNCEPHPIKSPNLFAPSPFCTLFCCLFFYKHEWLSFSMTIQVAI